MSVVAYPTTEPGFCQANLLITSTAPCPSPFSRIICQFYLSQPALTEMIPQLVQKAIDEGTSRMLRELKIQLSQ